MPSGRFAPSPSGRLHLGNLRTALVAWLYARHDDSPFHLRFDDLDPENVRSEHYQTQADDLQAIGLDWDDPPLRQSERRGAYDDMVATLVDADLVYPCYCSRREIREAASAPNQPLAGHAYPGTCRHLGRQARAQHEQGGRRPALRLRTEGETVPFDDLIAGRVGFEIDDFVVERNDGTPAYHLVTIVDDDFLDIQTVVRANDLLDSTSRQLYLARMLGLPERTHAHVGLVLSPGGERLAKRHGAVTLDDRTRRSQQPAEVLAMLAASIGFSRPGETLTPGELLDRFDPTPQAGHPLTEPLVLSEEFLA
ncbi:MAG: tRNA glutamyl-Q(34) synthetase GluQRS [Actinomycetia bacterium]|nr:tRNA glutamyl-Q(34) synthetase GluQRS [Actinomycetes bacterium]MCP4227792.1 tRNA glutamyl-Q(34) synthetase GluQRS [Actinomycetes bacterium]MCP5030443.1 tRNA glutamyl-Q(34) synthetase GluQRS [Actinomycetes bacterium]